MSLSTATRSFVVTGTTLARHGSRLGTSSGGVSRGSLRLMSSVSKDTSREMSSISKDTNRDMSSEALHYTELSGIGEASREDAGSSLLDRFKTTAEVTVSKIFPAGLGWQSSSIVAEDYLGYAPDTTAFALTTGLGDALGVFAGHCAYFAAKKAATGDDAINMEAEAQTGLLLGSAAFCSGTAWQPLVTALQGAGLDFSQVVAGTWLGCGAAFYLGLRAARTVLSGPCRHVAAPSYDNSATDASLSLAIGGATGFFVGTDTGESRRASRAGHLRRAPCSPPASPLCAQHISRNRTS